ncbi:uncharacterized protein LOC143030860 [Oratosquilla oratoria]|uniref:uncharacterized protein LOC143030860 n=1 Tax=Oratosquilla oratoria TaxID=337810 RepID=UPI003F7595D0
MTSEMTSSKNIVVPQIKWSSLWIKRTFSGIMISGLVLVILVTFNFLISTDKFLNLTSQTRPHTQEGTTASDSSCLRVPQRRMLAESIMEVQRHIASLAGTNSDIDAKWALQLESIASQLDLRLRSRQDVEWDQSALLPDMEPKNKQGNGLSHVCHEVYLGSSYDKPFNQHGMEIQKCDYAPPLSDVITVILPAQGWSNQRIRKVLTKLCKLYRVPVIVLARNSTSFTTSLSNVQVELIESDTGDANALNSIISTVDTPFTMIGHSLVTFSNQSSIERLIRVIDDLPHVQVATGAFRDEEGHWSHGCLQQKMLNYRAKFKYGYYYSKYECMYCDMSLGPFVTTTDLLRSVKFRENLTGTILYVDWFTKVRNAGVLGMACPDVMFFVKTTSNLTKQDWGTYAKAWELQTITDHHGVTFQYPCGEVGLTCNRPLDITKFFLLPPCCIEIVTKDIGFLVDIAEENNIEYNLQAGTVLGATKFGSYLPWDYDVDIFINCKDYDKWLRKGKKYVNTKNCTLNVLEKGYYFAVECEYFFYEFVCHNEISHRFLPKEYQTHPTSIYYSGRWIKVIANPGLFSRNRLGFEDLRHAQHWRHLVKNKNAEAKGGYENPGSWKPCSRPGFHACLDQYPGDGNLPFVEL